MAVLDQDSVRSRHRTLRTHRSVASIHRGKRACRVVYGIPGPVPAAEAWPVCKAISAAEVSHYVAAARCEWEAAARCGPADSNWTIAARDKSRRVAAVVERASRGHQPCRSKAAADGV